MNKPLRRISLFCGLLVLALLVRTNWLQYVQAEDLSTRKENRRVQIAQYATERGNIIVGGKPITGSSVTDGSDFKYKRTYLDGPLWAPVTGYASQAFGSTQLESLDDGILTGNDDRLFFDRTIGMFTGEKKQGGNVVTTLNAAAQKAAFEKLGNKKGAVAALDPRTGAILALVSTPSYDPSSFAGFSKNDEKAWVQLKDSEDKNLVNRALRETYPPGSTFKVVTAAAALEHGVVSDVNAATDTPEPYMLPGTRTPMVNHASGCEKATLNFALQVSCNSVFANMGDKVGRDKMVETAQKFGFNSTVDTPVRAFASVYDKTMGKDGNAQSSIGQFNTAATPLQMAMVTAAIANDGKLMKPYMVDELTAPNLDTVEKHEPQEMSRPLSAANAQKVQQMMVNVVEKGTGTPAKIKDVVVGGKTGTAQHGEKNAKRPYAWFISYAENPDGTSPVAVAVVIEDSAAEREDISGGGLAAPVAKAVMEAVLKSKG
ncbi:MULTISPECIES: peptidoglycan D,D-transpeptidase FtsI family protein [unclassified Streptomyces]|uniref:peptidoglycan D,D-transpeptidase FtsI family protein n=1 Tax=unclassified Streptomyces TaxID=2593676 RepID=UPI00226DAA3A|nr:MULTISPECIES: penicillin-binding transpeptidase domain-containing protein [unclassified Streptomyces]MCY0922487.1 penicillin-binding transpeptidase domain-containing protein [Streptomyces sp. H27-G5]MCY0958505.1 penicillin-binding transpeptidase domain-containing protein [Streptomyces sp. H27-H5]